MAEPARKLSSHAAVPTRSGTSNPIDALRREMDRLFANFGGGMPDFPLGRRGFDLDLLWPQGERINLAPAVDVTESDKAYAISVELPGLDQNDVEVKVANGTLTIRGEKRQEKDDHGKDYYVSERRYGSFVRSFAVPEGVDTDKIDAKFSKGVLTVALPKSEDAKSKEKTIEIKAD